MKVKANHKTYEVFRVSEMQSKEQLIAFMGHPDLVHTKLHGIGFGADVSYSVYIEDLDDSTVLLKDNNWKIFGCINMYSINYLRRRNNYD